MQNNLQYLSIGLLDPATYACTYQTKIVWSAILSVVLLGRVLQLQKWMAIACLTTGVCVVQLAGLGKEPLHSVQQEKVEAMFIAVPPQLVGLVLILLAAFASGCAGVYFEKILKGHRSSVWARNLQLAGWSVLTGFLALVMSPGFESVQRDLDAKQVGWLISQFLKELLSFLCSLAHFHSTLIYCFLLSPLR